MRDAYLNAYLPVTKTATGRDTTANNVKVEVYYSLGGTNVFSGSQEPRGIKLSVSPVTREDGIVRQMATHGYRKHLLTLAKKSAKKGEEVARQVQHDLDTKTGEWSVVQKVLDEFGLELAPVESPELSVV